MRRDVAGLLFILCAICAVNHAECYKILAIIPTPSYSHQIPYRRLWIELCNRGHELVVVTANPIKNLQMTNFTQVDVSGLYVVLRQIEFVKDRFLGRDWIDFIDDYLLDLSDFFAEQVFNSTQMRKLYAPDSNTTFDVVMAEFLFMPATYAFAHRFNAPLIGLSSLGLVALNEHLVGGLVLPSHEYTWEMEASTGQNLSFLKRLSNFVTMWRSVYHIYNNLFPKQQKLAEKYLGPLPPLSDIVKNVSMIFVDQSDVLTPAKPKPANMLTFTSFHIEDNPPPLSKDLQKFLDDAKQGFIYFSLGSNARSADLPEEYQRMLCDVFAELPYRIVWKYEKDLPSKPHNVFTGPWFPQQSILAHPNIKLFIYQGGVQSSEETIYYGVPVIGLPVLADQDYQTSRMEALGLGIKFEITTLTKEQLRSAIIEIINNKKYKETVEYYRTLVKDTPIDLVENLAWWTEYVIRTKGAPHLRSNLAWQPWYQRYDLDVIVFLTIAAYLIVSNLFNLIARLVVYLHKSWQISKDQKQKIS